MRQRLKEIKFDIDVIDMESVFLAVYDIKIILHKLLEELETALPKEVEPD